MPERIQRKRVSGWRMPPNTVSVTRPGKFGNPYTVDRFGIDLSLKLFEQTATGCWDATPLISFTDGEVHEIYEMHRTWLKRLNNHAVETIRCELRGKNLACWCGLAERCHADILLAIANE